MNTIYDMMDVIIKKYENISSIENEIESDEARDEVDDLIYEMYKKYDKDEIFEILLKYEEKYFNNENIYDLIVYINQSEEYFDKMMKIEKTLDPKYL